MALVVFKKVFRAIDAIDALNKWEREEMCSMLGIEPFERPPRKPKRGE